MYYYRIYDWNICVDIEIPCLVPLDYSADLELNLMIIERDLPEEFVQEHKDEWFHYDEKCTWFQNDYLLMMAENGTSLHYQILDESKRSLMPAYLIGWGFSIIASQKGGLGIHCSAVYNESGAVLIAGRSGSGKSTLTGMLLENGYCLMADDMAVVDLDENGCPMVHPAFPAQKYCRDEVERKNLDTEQLLYIDEEKDKFLVPYSGQFPDQAILLVAVVALYRSEDDVFEQREVAGLEKWFTVVNNQFLASVLGEEARGSVFGNRCLELAKRVPVYAFRRSMVRDTKTQLLEGVLTCLNSIK